MKRLGWGLFLVGSALLLISTPSLAVMHARCATAQSCAGSGSARSCTTREICWSIWEFNPVSHFVTDPITDWPGVDIPRWTPPDEDADAVADCWKDVTVNASISSGFPYRNNGTSPHNGVDVVSGTANYGRGAPIGSLGAGYVKEVDFNDLNGNFVRVAQGDGNTVTYIHLLSYTVSVGDKVAVGDQLGLMNCTGNCGGSIGDPNRGKISKTHVHIQVKRTSGNAVLDAVDLYGGESCSAKMPGGPTPPVPDPPGGGQQCLLAFTSSNNAPLVSPEQRHCP